MFDHALNLRIGQRGEANTTLVPRYATIELPDDAYPGQLVHNTDTNTLMVYDRDSDSWLEMVAAGTLIVTSTTRPAAPTTGQQIFESDTKRSLLWDGDSWEVTGGELPGVIKAYGGEILPAGYLWGRGDFVSQALYPDLFAAYGHKYNDGIDPGDGTFKLPDLTDRGLVGAGSKLLGERGGAAGKSIALANLPPHQHGADHDHPDTDLGGTHIHDYTWRESATGGGPQTNVMAAGGTAGTVVTKQIAWAGASEHKHNIPLFVGNTNDGSALGLTGTPLDVTNPYQAVNFLVKF